MYLHRCFECGYVLSDKWEAIDLMKKILEENSTETDVHIDKRILDPNQNNNLLPLFEFLNIKRYCCRKSILSQTDPSKLK